MVNAFSAWQLSIIIYSYGPLKFVLFYNKMKQRCVCHPELPQGIYLRIDYKQPKTFATNQKLSFYEINPTYLLPKLLLFR